MFGAKLVLWLGLGLGLIAFDGYYTANDAFNHTPYMRQFEDSDEGPRQVVNEHWRRVTVRSSAWGLWAALGVIFFSGNVIKWAVDRGHLDGMVAQPPPCGDE